MSHSVFVKFRMLKTLRIEPVVISIEDKYLLCKIEVNKYYQIYLLSNIELSSYLTKSQYNYIIHHYNPTKFSQSDGLYVCLSYLCSLYCLWLLYMLFTLTFTPIC